MAAVGEFAEMGEEVVARRRGEVGEFGHQQDTEIGKEKRPAAAAQGGWIEAAGQGIGERQ